MVRIHRLPVDSPHSTIDSRYIAAKYNTLSHRDFDFTKTGELWGVFRELFGERWLNKNRADIQQDCYIFPANFPNKKCLLYASLAYFSPVIINPQNTIFLFCRRHKPIIYMTDLSLLWNLLIRSSRHIHNTEELTIVRKIRKTKICENKGIIYSQGT